MDAARQRRRSRPPPEAWRAQRDALEEKIAALREKKATYAMADDYYRELEPLLLKLARLYAKDPS